MEKLLLNGTWEFKQATCGDWLRATVPGDNFSDLLTNKKIEDPFKGLNEAKVQWIANENWIYRRNFEVNADQFGYDAAELTFEMLDTLATVYVNGEEIAYCDNVNIGYTFNIKKQLKLGINTVTVLFRSPVNYISEMQKKDAMPNSFNGLNGAPHIRKTQCHFGWDWGPTMPISGMPRDVYITFYNTAKIVNFKSIQKHEGGKVEIDVKAELFSVTEDKYEVSFMLTSPDGKTEEIISDSAVAAAKFKVDKPELWWPNGMSDVKCQPLYTLEISIIANGKVLHSVKKRIGLRTIELDRSPDKYGKQFCFKVNGVPIFARGADWIPADSLISRFTQDKLDYFIAIARDCNMNMLRIWGGGYYESDAFYDKCDEYGILLWQDFAYACAPYPFYDDDFRKNCDAEAEYNIKRLRHHASLALWCGNNEIESCGMAWINRRKLLEWSEKYFWHILPEIVAQNDGVTAYIPSSPYGSSFMNKVSSDSEGDTHLWAVWHGLKPLTFYRKRFTRFCSEFGLESLPDIKTIEYFAEPKDYSMHSDVFMAHQKCKSGNNKILFYISTRFKLPKVFEDLVYLSGIIQGECMKDATEHWRRNRGRCNGSLFWQLNDCWPVNSWASVDYFGRFKALQYFSKRFDAPQTISAYNEKGKVRIFGLNDRSENLNGIIEYWLQTFDGKILDEGNIKVNMPAVSSVQYFEKDYKKQLKAVKGNAVFKAVIKNDMGKELAHEFVLFKPEKDLILPKADIKTTFKFKDGIMNVTLTTDMYARYIHLDVKDTYKPFSDNYFDMTAGESRTVFFPLDEMTEEEFKQKFSVRSLGDVTEYHSKFYGFLTATRIRLIPINIAQAIGYSFK